MPTKKLQDAIKNGEQVETQAVAAEIKQEFTSELSGSYTTYADFEFRGKQYKEGDKFTPPDGLTEDKVATEFQRGATQKKGNKHGTVFTYVVVSYKKDEMGGKVEEKTEYQQILPVE